MKTIFWSLLLAIAVVGCRHLMPGDTKPGRSPVATTATSSQPGVVALSPANTSIAFTGSTALTSHSGRFESFVGTLEMPTNDPKDMKIRVSVDMDSTSTSIGLLTKHLKAEDFFDVAHYPKSEFVLDSIAPTSEPGRFQVAGKLTLHGVQKPIAFPARIAISPGEVSFDATMTIRQTEFGMVEAAKKTKDDVPVSVSIRSERGETMGKPR